MGKLKTSKVAFILVQLFARSNMIYFDCNQNWSLLYST